MGGILRDLGMEGALRLGRIAGNWDALFSGPLARHTFPQSISQDTLTVNVDSPAWMQQANFMKKGMLAKLSPYGITSIRFMQGRVEQRLSTPAPAPLREPLPEEIKAAEKLVAGIEDSELRNQIMKAVLRSISKKK